jgi:hypothetical protein
MKQALMVDGFGAFASHTKGAGPETAALVRTIKMVLELKGVKVFNDVDDLEIITLESLKAAIAVSTIFLLVLDDHTFNSKWCRAEIAFAAELDTPIYTLIDKDRFPPRVWKSTMAEHGVEGKSIIDMWYDKLGADVWATSAGRCFGEGSHQAIWYSEDKAGRDAALKKIEECIAFADGRALAACTSSGWSAVPPREHSEPKFIRSMKHAGARDFWAAYSPAAPSMPWTQFVDFFAMEFMDGQPGMTAAQQQALKKAIDGEGGDSTITTREFDRWATANELGESWGVPAVATVERGGSATQDDCAAGIAGMQRQLAQTKQALQRKESALVREQRERTESKVARQAKAKAVEDDRAALLRPAVEPAGLHSALKDLGASSVNPLSGGGGGGSGGGGGRSINLDGTGADTAKAGGHAGGGRPAWWRLHKARIGVGLLALTGLLVGVVPTPSPTAATTPSPTAAPTPNRTLSPTVAPTPSPTVVPTPSLATRVSSAADGVTIDLAAGTHAWASDVACNKTVTVTGAGKGVTVLDAGNAGRFFTLLGSCTLTLKHLSLRNGKATHNGGAISIGENVSPHKSGTLIAIDVEFKDNSGSQVQRAAPMPPHRPPPAAADVAPTHTPSPSPHHLSCSPHIPGQRGVHLPLRQRFLHEL